MSELRVVTETGEALCRHLDDITRLRIQVFRAWPYLYDGDAAYERRYLQTYIDTPDAMVALWFDGERVVGASTALPLAHETEEIRRPFDRTDDTHYLGESVLDPAYRGRGIGLAFFDVRDGLIRRVSNYYNLQN